MKITLCQTCILGQGDFEAALFVAVKSAGIHAEITGVECMSGCTRPSTISFRHPGKTAYLFGDLGPGDLTDLVTFARLYADSPDGNLADARPLGALRTKVIARIPG